METKTTRMIQMARDTRLTQQERDAALQVLREIAATETSPAERERATAAVKELDAEGALITAAPVRSTEDRIKDLLASAGARFLFDVTYGEVHKFCSALRWSPEAKAVYEEWCWSGPLASEENKAAARARATQGTSAERE